MLERAGRGGANHTPPDPHLQTGRPGKTRVVWSASRRGDRWVDAKGSCGESELGEMRCHGMCSFFSHRRHSAAPPVFSRRGVEQSSRALLDLRPRRARTKAREELGRAADGTPSFQVAAPSISIQRPTRTLHGHVVAAQSQSAPYEVLLGSAPRLVSRGFMGYVSAAAGALQKPWTRFRPWRHVSEPLWRGNNGWHRLAAYGQCVVASPTGPGC